MESAAVEQQAPKEFIPEQGAPMETENSVVIPDSACKFAEIGCDVSAPNHEEKKPVKHLTLLNDELRSIQKKFEELTDAQDQAFVRFGAVKTDATSALNRAAPQLLWRIDDWHARMRSAKARLEPWVLSSPFSSDAYGYQLIAMVAPYGYDEGYGKALSVFVQIIPGDFDAILRWPFSRKVTVTLYDQRSGIPQRKNYVFTLDTAHVAPEEAEHVQRPTAQSPPCRYGCRNFCPLREVVDGPFVMENSIFISVRVD